MRDGALLSAGFQPPKHSVELMCSAVDVGWNHIGLMVTREPAATLVVLRNRAGAAPFGSQMLPTVCRNRPLDVLGVGSEPVGAA